MAIVVVEIVHDGLLQFVDALEDAAADAFSGDLGKEALDHVEPRAGRGREVQTEARMPLEPALYRGGLVGSIIIDDQMQVEIGQRPLVDGLEKAEELAMPVAGHAFADDGAVEHVERPRTGSWCRCACSHASSSRSGPSSSAARLGAVKGLDLARIGICG